MDVVVVPYPAEGETYFSPLKLFEAMAMGKPVIGARIGEVAKVLAGEKNGLLYQPGNTKDLTSKLRKLLAAPDEWAALGNAAREWVVSRRTWDLSGQRIMGAVKPLVRER